MKLTVFGATGGIGRQLIRQGIAKGHEMTAIARRPAELDCDVVVAELDDAEAIAAAVAGRDAVLSALGVRPGGSPTVQADGARAAVAAMRATGVRRIVSVDAAGRVADKGDGIVTRSAVKPLLQRILRESFADLAVAEQVLRAGGLDWTLISPPRLTDGGHRPYRTVVGRNVRGGRSLSRADVADAMFASLADPAQIRQRVNIAY
jgi:putative NADH-flavin reductase